MLKDQILQAGWMVGWLSMEDGPMGEDNNDMWDWDGNDNN